MGEQEAIKKALYRERQARKAAEAIIETKSLEIYKANQELIALNNSLEGKILERTSEIEASRQQLIKAKNEAERSTQAKSLFLSNMSHEIRTPLNGIINVTDIMLRETGEKNIQDMLDTVKYSADHLLGIINDILDFSKIESGKITLEKIPFNLKTLVNQLVKVMNYKAVEKKLDFGLEWNNNMPKVIVGDKVKLNQILTNLLGNAFKFTEKGFVKLKIDCLKKKGDQSTVEFTVIDSGIGIPKEKVENVFKSFTQSSQSITRKYGGTGLGLTITKRLVKLQGGKLEVSSIEHVGSEFRVVMPYKFLTDLTQQKPKQTPSIKDGLQGRKVLVVEDNSVNQFVAIKILQNWGVETRACENGLETVNMLKYETFDLILLDLHMPVMDGYEAAQNIRTSSSGVIDNKVPIIALSADAFTNNRQKIFDAGMNDFASKPINQNELYEKMLQLLNLQAT